MESERSARLVVLLAGALAGLGLGAHAATRWAVASMGLAVLCVLGSGVAAWIALRAMDALCERHGAGKGTVRRADPVRPVGPVRPVDLSLQATALPPAEPHAGTVEISSGKRRQREGLQVQRPAATVNQLPYPSILVV